MPFRDLDDVLVVRPIELPIGGKMYAFPGTISGRAGLLLRRLREQAEDYARARSRAEAEGRELAAGDLPDGDRDLLDEAESVDLRAEVMGDGEAALLADGCTAAQIEHVWHTLTVWHMAGREAAERAWEEMSADPPEPNRAERRKGSSGSAKSTQSPASTSGTRAPRKRQAARPGGTS